MKFKSLINNFGSFFLLVNFKKIVGHAKGVDSMSSLSEWTHKQFDPQLDWKSIEWIKERWDGPLILKGINDVEDAKIAAKTGADAIIVSNHGGRQLDGAAASIDVLGAIAIPELPTARRKPPVIFRQGN